MLDESSNKTIIRHRISESWDESSVAPLLSNTIGHKDTDEKADGRLQEMKERTARGKINSRGNQK